MKLRIIDFDGTLFRSPVPKKNLWQNEMFGRIRGDPESNGLGWFQDIVTLEPPYVPEVPDETWYSKEIVTLVKETMEDESFVNVLLTGRSVNFSDRIIQICTNIGINIKHYGLKPLNGCTTMDFKTDFIRNMIAKYSPVSVVLFEDRPEHVKKFNNFFSSELRHINYQVIAVERFDTYLPDDAEIELVRKLIQNRGLNLEISAKVSYAGIFIDEESKKFIFNTFPVVEGWVLYGDHMTVTLGPLPEESTSGFPTKKNIGEEYQLKIVGVGKGSKAYALKVEGCKSKNKIPHITICCHPDAKPYDSNEIPEENWKLFGEDISYYVKGILKEKATYGVYKERREKRKQGKGNKQNGGNEKKSQ